MPTERATPPNYFFAHVAFSMVAFILVFLLGCWLQCCWCSADAAPRYLLYSVNPGEGFNLRRDVHMRAATLVSQLRTTTTTTTLADEFFEDWRLVLPPWPRLHHWRSKGVRQSSLKWETFFDVPSLGRYVPSIEFEDFLALEEELEEVSIYSSP